MNGKIFGVSIATLLVIVVTAVLVKKFGSSIPVINKIG